MSEYLVLARKYRSTTFDEVIGQAHVADTLTNAIESGRIAHAYLFSGTRGVGKTTMARILAKCLNCLESDGPTSTPCNKCESCLDIARGEDMDVVEIDGASNNGVEDIRELRANVIYRPSRSRYKVYYIDEVHMVTTQAFNALLKTLEEPPEYVKFMFATTEPEKIPATILSRCQRFDFRNISTSVIADYLKTLCEREKVNSSDDGLFRVARAASGSMRDALSLLDQIFAAGGEGVTEAEVLRLLGSPSDEKILNIVNAIATGDSAGAIGGLAEILSTGATLPSVAGSLVAMFRNIMLAATCGADSELIETTESSRKQIVESAGAFSVPSIVHAVGALQKLHQELKRSSLPRPLFEAILVRLAESEKFIDPASLLDRIAQIEAGGGIKKKTW